MKANEFFKAMGLNAVKQFLENNNIRTKEMRDDLKRLVESHELVGKVGGMDKAKMLLRMRIAAELYDSADEIDRAIADVESCQ
jgi:hypothetical protein